MSGLREVEWLGGPRDGERLTVPEDAGYVEFNAPVWLQEDGGLATELGADVPPEAVIKTEMFRVPIRHRWLAWGERRLVP